MQMNCYEIQLLVARGIRMLRRKLRPRTTVVFERRRDYISAVGPGPSWGGFLKKTYLGAATEISIFQMSREAASHKETWRSKETIVSMKSSL